MESLIGNTSTVSPWHYYHDGNVQQEKLANRIIDDDQRLSASNTVCHLCNSHSTIFDGLIGETICSNCATVISDRQTTFENDSNIKSKLGQPTSLVFPDKGLPSVITSSNTDAYGTSPKIK